MHYKSTLQTMLRGGNALVVEITRRSDAALIIISNPPVNAIGKAVRQGLQDAFKKLAVDASVARIILTGCGGIFAAGADTREFDGPAEPPHLPDVAKVIEASNVPCIAAIEGAALGGGCELALACDYRIAGPTTKIGLPEVTLGVVPGAGGTQKLPRLIGIATAVTLISQGRVLDGTSAKDCGLIDEIADAPVEAALQLDLSLPDSHAPLSRRPCPAPDDAACEAARGYAKKRLRGQDAPLRAIELVELSSTMSVAEGMQQERDTFLALRQSGQARALRHVFFAERGARRPDSLSDVSPVDVKKVVVAGGGTMGTAISYALNVAGIEVHIIEADHDGVARANVAADKLFSSAVERGLMSDERAGQHRKSLTIAAGFDDLPEADLAIEAAIEDMAVKKDIFRSLETALPAHAVLATNTSYLDIDEIAAGLADPQRVLGLHFFAPAHIMKLLEIIRGKDTSDVALATAYSVARTLRKTPVLAGVCDGFIGNRILARYREIADVIMIDGSLPWEIDAAMTEFGYAMGPYAAQDLSGLDIAYANRKRLAPSRDPARRYVTISDRMVEEGRVGRKGSVGWYRYPGGGGAVIDPLLEDMIVEEAGFAGITRRDFSPDEIRERILAAMINEACDILADGIAEKPSDIDLVLVHGYGFPRWRGGLMYYGQTIGFDTVLRQIREYSEEDPVLWQPSPYLIRLGQAP